jgi:hypothetical protein
MGFRLSTPRARISGTWGTVVDRKHPPVRGTTAGACESVLSNRSAMDVTLALDVETLQGFDEADCE